jgi:hypothetical protein
MLLGTSCLNLAPLWDVNIGHDYNMPIYA